MQICIKMCTLNSRSPSLSMQYSTADMLLPIDVTILLTNARYFHIQRLGNVNVIYTLLKSTLRGLLLSLTEYRYIFIH